MNKKKILLFIGLVFILSYSIALLFWKSGLSVENTVSFTLLGIIYMFIPALCVLIVQKFVYKQNLSSELLISFKLNKWYLIAWIIMPIIAFITMGISLLLPDVFYSPDMSGMFKRFANTITPDKIEKMKESIEKLPIHPIWIGLIQGMIAGITINAIAAFGEELGWRGFLLKELKELKFVMASIIIGLIWGIWHAPLILMGHNYPQHPHFGVVMMTIWCILLTLIFLYITIKSESVIAASILHGTLNGTAGLAIILIDGGNDLITGVTGLSGFISIILAVLILFIYDRYISKENIFSKKIQDSILFK